MDLHSTFSRHSEFQLHTFCIWSLIPLLCAYLYSSVPCRASLLRVSIIRLPTCSDEPGHRVHTRLVFLFGRIIYLLKLNRY
ncbi:hypothetical protein SISSUDRAFT_726159 [Sistotremastrum suecicum HHB10207 ss-3]|uniref:Uncharacterized protein n=1 Tax=Sistotremastrum suecicum HHB10207 ss-3 TaxID=1314776 RepID=A0A166DJM0_9AGAM|nr:hypothetical protein SISSUDRAFT_726159 [Sistotremastrum suecicum HHB10207 ss-3]